MTDPRQNKIPIPREAHHILQGASCHVGVVKDLKDPLRKGRVRVEIRSLLEDGDYRNWSNWCEMSWLPMGGSAGNGDMGMWWCPVPKELVTVAFPGGDYYASPIVFPFSAWNASKDDKSEMIPAEAKVYSDNDVRQGTRIRLLKSEAGHTLLMDDNGKAETLALLDWTGAGHFSVAPGQTEDQQEQKNDESKYRKGEVRGVKSVMAGTSWKPSELIAGGVAITGEVDLNGQGIYRWAQDDKGRVMILSAKENQDIGPSIILDADNNCIILTAGETQFVVNGAAGLLQGTRHIIQEKPKIDISEFFQAVRDRLANYFLRYAAYNAPKIVSTNDPTEVSYS